MDFPEVRTLNVILTYPWNGPQVATEDDHDCAQPMPYEVELPEMV